MLPSQPPSNALSSPAFLSYDLSKTPRSLEIRRSDNTILRMPDSAMMFSAQQELHHMLEDIHTDPKGFVGYVDGLRKEMIDESSSIACRPASPINLDSAVGDTYTLLGKVGAGRFSTVYKAATKGGQHLFAVKVVRLGGCAASINKGKAAATAAEAKGGGRNNNNNNNNRAEGDGDRNHNNHVAGGADDKPKQHGGDSLKEDDPYKTMLTKCLKEVGLLKTLQHPNIVRYKECFLGAPLSGDDLAAPLEQQQQQQQQQQQNNSNNPYDTTPSDNSSSSSSRPVGAPPVVFVGGVPAPPLSSLPSLYIVLEWAPNGDLKSLLSRYRSHNRLLPPSVINDYFKQLSSALEHMHSRRVLHRDVKPSNILLLDGGRRVAFTDLGLGRHLARLSVAAFSQVGTPLYMSPEVLRGEGHDFASDVWSLGVTIYECAVGDTPFQAEHKQKARERSGGGGGGVGASAAPPSSSPSSSSSFSAAAAATSEQPRPPTTHAAPSPQAAPTPPMTMAVLFGLIVSGSFPAVNVAAPQGGYEYAFSQLVTQMISVDAAARPTAKALEVETTKQHELDVSRAQQAIRRQQQQQQQQQQHLEDNCELESSGTDEHDEASVGTADWTEDDGEEYYDDDDDDDQSTNTADDDDEVLSADDGSSDSSPVRFVDVDRQQQQQQQQRAYDVPRLPPFSDLSPPRSDPRSFQSLPSSSSSSSASVGQLPAVAAPAPAPSYIPLSRPGVVVPGLAGGSSSGGGVSQHPLHHRPTSGSLLRPASGSALRPASGKSVHFKGAASVGGGGGAVEKAVQGIRDVVFDEEDLRLMDELLVTSRRDERDDFDEKKLETPPMSPKSSEGVEVSQNNPERALEEDVNLAPNGQSPYDGLRRGSKSVSVLEVGSKGLGLQDGGDGDGSSPLPPVQKYRSESRDDMLLSVGGKGTPTGKAPFPVPAWKEGTSGVLRRLGSLISRGKAARRVTLKEEFDDKTKKESVEGGAATSSPEAKSRGLLTALPFAKIERSKSEGDDKMTKKGLASLF